MGVSPQTISTSTLVSKSAPAKVTNLQRLLWVSNTFYYQILAIISVVFLWIFFDEASENTTVFTLHLILSTVAYVPLMAAAIILFSEDNVIALYIPRSQRYTIHGVLLFVSAVAVSIGIGVETHAKSQKGRSKHFTSMHAKLGLLIHISSMSTDMIEKSFSASQTTILKSSELKMVSKLQRLLWLGNLLYYQIVAILMTVMLWVFFENNALSSLILWHMVLCTMAYVPLMAVAIISFSKDNLPTLYIPRQKIYLIHGVMLTISCAAVTVGISIEVHNKAKKGSTHFHSTHAILGLTSWILVFCSVCFGIVAANTQVFARYIKPVVAKLLHNILGIGAFVIGVACFMVMFKSHHYKNYLSSSSYYATYYAGTYIIIWSLLAAFRSLFSQFGNVIS